jgi:hypothetical protein
MCFPPKKIKKLAEISSSQENPVTEKWDVQLLNYSLHVGIRKHVGIRRRF